MTFLTVLGIIFKVLGIILLSILGLILFLLFVIAVFPITYKASVKKHENQKAEVLVKVLWFQLYPEVPKKQKKNSWFRKKRTVEQKSGEDDDLKIKEDNEVEDYPLIEEEVKAFEVNESKENKVPQNEPPTVGVDYSYEDYMDDEILGLDLDTGESAFDKPKVSEPVKERGEKKEPKKSIKKKRKKFFESASKIEEKEEKAKSKISEFVEKYNKLKEELTDPGNIAAVKHVWRELMFLLRHYGPRKVICDVNFAGPGPDVTGIILGAVAMCPFVYGKKTSIKPDFEAEKAFFDGEAEIKGVIQLMFLFKSGLSLLFDKNVVKLVKRFMEDK